MKPLGTHNYFVYITTNKFKKVLYTGITNDLNRRLKEHYQDSITEKKHFTGRYNAFHLIYWERFIDVNQAIRREKEIKGWTREKKLTLIRNFNPEFRFLNDEV